MAEVSREQQLLTSLQQSATVIQKLKGQLGAYKEPIAVIGMACRFPGGSDSPEQFWQLLQAGREGVIEMPQARRSTPRDNAPLLPCYGGFLPDVESFDPAFFGISPREAMLMDPQHRLLLEVTWEALEAAYLMPESLFNSTTGVFVGMCANDYALLVHDQTIVEPQDKLHKLTGISPSVAAGRLAYVLGLTGPAVVVDTACSSSLVALHQACQSLRNRECNLALAGGVNLVLTDDWAAGSAAPEDRMFAPDGRCKTFDAAANGFGRGEGCGMIVLKRLSDAQADGDPILALVRGSMVNQDGRSSGLTAPSGPSQQAVIRQALQNAGVEPGQVDYIEAHGTGTTLGDPIEIGALNAVFGQRPQPLWVGSVKTNFGHLEGAAGVAGLIKIVLSFQHEQLPPHLNFQHPNPYIDWTGSSIQIPVNLTAWPASATRPRMAGVSGFGISGTNAHVVVEQAPSVPLPAKPSNRPYHLLTLSAKNEAALRTLAQKYAEFLPQTCADIGDLCYTAYVGRTHFAQRLSVTAASVEQLQSSLRAYVQGEPAPDVVQGQALSLQTSLRVAFLFTGQGAQSVNMGRELYETQPAFRQVLDECDTLLQAHLGESVLAMLYPPAGATASRIDETQYTQPALFMLEYALAKLWQQWGVQPAYLLGHSVGELVAACVAGVFSLADALKLVAARGRLMGALPADGAMVALLTTEARAQAAVAPYAATVAVAAVNGPTSVVISGQKADVQTIAAQLAAEGIKTRPLTVSHAFHSPLLDPMLADFAQVAQTLTYAPPTLPLVSNVTGQFVNDEVTTPAYWVRQARAAVRFAAGVATVQAAGVDAWLELGPKPTLLGLLDEIQGLKLPSLRPERNDWQQLLTSLGALYTHGAPIDWPAFEQRTEAARARRKAPLPTYPFQRQRYWLTQDNHQAHDPTKQNAFAQWLAGQSLEQLTQLITDKGHFTVDERGMVARVLTTLEAENRAQELAAQTEAMLYEVAWERKNALPSVTPPIEPGCWLLLTDAQGVGTALASQLSAIGEQVHCFAADTPLAVITAWLQQNDAPASPLRGVVYLGSLNADLADPTPLDAKTLEQLQQTHCGSVLQLVQTLASRPGALPRLWIVTQGAQMVLPTQANIALTQTPLWGLGRGIGLEHPLLWGGLLDLEPGLTLTQGAPLLVAELLKHQDDGEDQIAYRNGSRYVARLVHSRLPKTKAQTVAIHADATYLITGGLGALGLLLADWLAEQGARHLILTGRRGITQADQQAAVDALQEKGVNVQIAQVDVADADAMQRLFAEIGRQAQPLRGVIHAAGIVGFQALNTLQWADVAAVMRPKIVGGWLLHQLTKEMALDFFICYASGAGIWGSKQQAHYGAANHFLDGLAAYRRALGLPAMSIAWGPWAGGIATPEAQAMLLAMGVRAFAPHQGLAIQTRLLASDATQIVAADIQWSRLKALYEFAKPRRFLDQLQAEPSTAKQAGAQRPKANRTVTSRAALLGFIQEKLTHILRLPNQTIDQHQGFAEMGMDSLMTLELKRLIETELALTLPATLALEYPTVALLTDYLWGVLATTPNGAPAAPPTAAQPTTAQATDAIAVLSIGCRFPGATSPEAFWEMLRGGVDMVREVPRERWSVDEYYNPQRPMPGKMYTRNAAFLANVDQFDPLFFGISPREAVGIDPQHRLLLEVSWEALERAGLAQATLVDSQTGVFVGISASDYGPLNHVQTLSELDTHAVTSSGHSIAAGRLAYTLGLQGPTMAVDTACSSSLVALHLACQSLRAGECDLALAGGVQLMLSPTGHVMLSQMQALAPDGRCKTFDATADGYGRGEGCAMVVLKRLADAEAAGDPILAVIKGSAVNHDGPSSGLTVPNKRAQEKLLRQALANAQLTPDAVAYIEAHGTGTSLGDPLEMRALGSVFGRERPTPLLVGSVKTNVGHLEAAAGIAGLAKVVLALSHGKIPPHLHFNTPNPYIEWDEFAVEVPTTLRPWPTGARIAGISAFGISGTNAHVIVTAAPDTPMSAAATPARPWHLLPLAAKTQAALADTVAQYAAFLSTAAPEIGDLCYTAATGRNHFAHRLAIVAASLADLQEKLALYQRGEASPAILQSGGPLGAEQPPAAPRIAFLFTGQGAQAVNMGRELYEPQPEFRQVLDECDTLLQAHLGESVLAVLYPPADVTTSRIDETQYTQPALFVLEYALAKLWQQWGVQPAYLLGHSVGEIVAACVAGVFSLADALKLVAARGRLMGALPPDGAMVALLTTEARAQAAVAPYAATVAVAAVNGPTSVVISGKRADVQAIAAQLAAEGIKTRLLTVSHAFHSPLLDPMLAEFAQVAQTLTYAPPTVPLVSNVTGQFVNDEVTTPAYWVRQARAAVRFAAGVATVQAAGVDAWLELGPKPTLLGLLDETQGLKLPSLRPERNDWQQLLTSLGTLYAHGATIDWQTFDQPAGAPTAHRKVVLPTYPFQRQRYWLTPAVPTPTMASLRPLIDRQMRLPLQQQVVFEKSFSATTLPFLADHYVYDEVVVPGACHLALALSAAELLGQSPCLLHDVVFPQALVLPAHAVRTVQCVTTAPDANDPAPATAFRILSFVDQETAAPLTHATGRLLPTDQAPALVDLAALQARCATPLASATVYTAMGAAHINLGPRFCWLDAIWRNEGQGEALARLQQPAAISTQGYALFPSLVDTFFQLVAASMLDQTRSEGQLATLLPFALETFTFYASPAPQAVLWCHVVQGADQRWAITLFTESGQRLATVQGFELRPAPPSAVHGARLRTDWLYTQQWQSQPLAAPTSSPVQPQLWLILGAKQGVGQSISSALASQLSATGAPAVLVTLGTTYALHQPNGKVMFQATLPLTEPSALRQMLADVAAQSGQRAPAVGVIALGGLDAPAGDDAPAQTLQLTTDLLQLTQALAAIDWPTRLWLVTQQIQQVASRPGFGRLLGVGADNGELGRRAAAGALWGLARTIAQELPNLACTCIDLAELESTQAASCLCQEVLGAPQAGATPAESQIAYRQGTRYVAQLAHWQPAAQPARPPQRLQLSTYGSIDHLTFVPLTRRAPSGGEVEVEVKAAGLNFRDVLNALGMLQSYYADVLNIHDPREVGLGLECAGVVTAVGDGVTEFVVGDRVMGMINGTFANYIVAPASALAKIPEHLTFEAAATVPVTYLTAWYGLKELANLQAGEHVLIHAAAGGVGQAAVQIAQALGATVHGTASSGKAAFLRAQGVDYVYGSRALHFAEQVRQNTGGAGVAVILNSLNGEFIDQSFAVLGHQGRFVEIGKIGIWTMEQAQSARPDAAYFPFDIAEVGFQDPTLHPRLWRALSNEFAAGRLKPLPHTVFTCDEIVDAFRFMQQAKHIGKIVISFQPAAPVTLHPDASYLITGGLGALGLHVAEQLVADGARHLVLSGRRGLVAGMEAVQERLRALETQGASVHIVPADMGERSEVEQLLAQCQAIAPLRGIVHAAGILDDGGLLQQSAARLATVMRPKVHGAWHLHCLTQGLPLDFFICFSSAAALLGSAGQGNYAAANAFMDTLMQARRQQGLPGLSINWGPWAEAGMAAALHDRMQSKGMGLISAAQGRALFQALVGQPIPQIGVIPAQLAWLEAKRNAGQPPASSAPTQAIRQQLAAHNSEQRFKLLTDYLRSEIASVLGLNSGVQIDMRSRLFDFGLDSLMAVELKNKLQAGLGCSLRSTLLFDYPTLEALTPYLLHEVLQIVDEPASAAPSAQMEQTDLEEVEALSSAELLAFIDQKFEDVA